MIDLAGVATDELRAELNRRDEDARQEREQATLEQVRSVYGVCQHQDDYLTIGPRAEHWEGPCGLDFRTFETEEIRPILQTPPDWPAEIPCPEASAWTVGQEFEVTLGCRRGHRTVSRRTTMYDQPFKPMFR